MDNARRRRVAKLETSVAPPVGAVSYVITASGNEADIRLAALQEHGVKIDAPDVLLFHLIGVAGSENGPFSHDQGPPVLTMRAIG